MSIFDISSQKPYQFLHKWDSFQSTEGDPTIFFAGIFALKKVSGQYKTKNINILGTKLVFLSIKTQRAAVYLNLEDLFSLKYYKEDFFEYPHHIILQKNENTINFATSSKKSFEELFTILKKYCILDDFNLKYEILEKLGSGYFSIVFEARNKSNGKEFAAKIITKNKEFYQHMQKFVIKEIKTLKFLPPCPYVIELLEVYENSIEIIMVFEYMRGNDMYNKIKNYKPLSEQQVFNYFSQLMKGFLFLQFHGVCHRDIKPDNILFVDENRLKIADFSLVENYNTKMKGICGTPGFMAPEIFYQETYDEKIDVFSLGAVLYVMLTGTSLFRGKNAEDIKNKNKTYKPDVKNKKFLNLSKPAQHLVLRMIHKNCEKRITLKDICLSKWFMSNYHHIQNPISSKMTSSHPKYKSNYLSDPELISPPGEIQLKKAKTSCFKKISKDVVFSNEDFLDDEGRLPMNIYTMKPKFLFSENPNPESSSFLNYAKGNNPKINEGSMANSCFFLGVNSFMISPNSEISGSNQLSINSFGGKSLSNLSIDDSASPKKCFEMHSSLVLYMKYPNNNWISEKSIEDNDKCTNLIGKDSTRGLLTLRTKRGDDIDIEKEVQKMKNIKCKWLKF